MNISTGFNPIKDIQYSFTELDNNQSELKIYYLIDATRFVYEKSESSQYSSSVDIVFQVSDPNNQKEIDRKLIEIEILKDSFSKTKKDNYYEGEVSFLIDKKAYSLNTRLIDKKSMNSWFKKSEITTGSSKYFSRLNLYYNDNGEEIRIEDDLNFEIDGFNCSFYYFNKDKSIKKLKLFLLNRSDTLYKQNIPISLTDNSYNESVSLSDNIVGDIICHVSDGDTFRESKFSIIGNLGESDFWSYDSEMIETIMRYILPYKEYKKIKKMDDEEMIFYLKSYWESLDPDKNSLENELLIELNNRIKRVNSRFNESKTDGWNTDRGKTYIINGEPISIRTEINPQTNNLREIWSYQSGRIYIFEQNSFGRYYMINDGF